MLVQACPAHRLSPIEHMAIASTREQRCDPVLAGKRVNRSQVVAQHIGQPRCQRHYAIRVGVAVGPLAVLPRCGADNADWGVPLAARRRTLKQQRHIPLDFNIK